RTSSVGALSVSSAMVAGCFGSSITASATSTTYTIGVDNATPNGHDFEYVDFFPRGLPLDDSGASPTLIPDGATLDFAWNPGSPDGFHTATLLKAGTAPGPNTRGSDHPVAVPDSDDGTGKLQLNPAILAPGPDPSCGHDVGSPCHYGGGTELNSGAQPTATGAHYFVNISLDTSSPTTVHFVCLIHPGMQGAVTVVPANSESSPLTPAPVQIASTRFRSSVRGQAQWTRPPIRRQALPRLAVPHPTRSRITSSRVLWGRGRSPAPRPSPRPGSWPTRRHHSRTTSRSPSREREPLPICAGSTTTWSGRSWLVPPAGSHRRAVDLPPAQVPCRLVPFLEDLPFCSGSDFWQHGG